MKTLFLHAAATCACLCISFTSLAQTSEYFNSRSGVATEHIKAYLEARCWQLDGFHTSGNAPIEGDGSLVSDASGKSAGIYTPVLNIWNNFTISFRFAFTSATASAESPIRIYLVTANNDIVRLLDTVTVAGLAAGQVRAYRQDFPAASGVYRLYINYEKAVDAPLLMIDEMQIGANLRYKTGCNAAPVAISDVITGQANRTASGYVTQNDFEPNGEGLSSYLITSCADGTVTMAMNGFFSFAPKPDFHGNTTTFTYQICDNGFTQLCSDIATVTLIFPPAAIPTFFPGLEATFANRAVTLSWKSGSDFPIDRFEIERSVDGTQFNTAGVMQAVKTAGGLHNYLFNDDLAQGVIKKHDLYYRLKVIDAMGRSFFSKTLIVRVFHTKTLESVSVVPNPAVNDINVHLQLNEGAYAVIRLRSSSGGELHKKSLKVAQGRNLVSLEGTRSLKQGIYFLEVIVNGKESMTVKVMKGN